MKNLLESYRGKRVFVTGNTGFKGSWLCEWLLLLGAEVTGYSLPSPTQPALFEQLGLASRIKHVPGDVRDIASLCAALLECRPEHVFHLAAQPLVRVSYDEPLLTWQTNVQGTTHLLEALREVTHPCAAVFITTDKVYENREWLYAYREDDTLGGHDPYSASKAAAELAISAWRRSFFVKHPVKIASVRAGNVIGGGDWARDRIVPDTFRHLQKGEPIIVRNPSATRPWQHVLEPLSGYLLLGAVLAGERKNANPTDYQTPFNFGPSLASNRPVRDLVNEILKHWPGTWVDQSNPSALHEAELLNLTIEKAWHLLGWQPRWEFAETMQRTTEWYRQAQNCRTTDDFITLTRGQIHEYLRQPGASSVDVGTASAAFFQAEQDEPAEELF